MAKQTEVERLNSERGSLVVRMEGLESLLQSAERKNATANNSVAVPMPNNNSTKGNSHVYVQFLPPRAGQSTVQMVLSYSLCHMNQVTNHQAIA